jgi:hypothetical protein
VLDGLDERIDARGDQPHVGTCDQHLRSFEVRSPGRPPAARDASNRSGGAGEATGRPLGPVVVLEGVVAVALDQHLDLGVALVAVALGEQVDGLEVAVVGDELLGAIDGLSGAVARGIGHGDGGRGDDQRAAGAGIACRTTESGIQRHGSRL